MNQKNPYRFCLVMVLCAGLSTNLWSQKITHDTVVYHFIYRDTIVYRYDTVHVRRFVTMDTLLTKSTSPMIATEPAKRKGWYNPTSWGIGPSLGAYYSPYHGFDVNIGFGVQYYLFAVPSFRNPHMGSRKHKK